MKPAGVLSRLGFDRDRLRYSLRTAVGACLALLIAWLAGLEHPQWAAMTVFAASQPARNMLVEKSFFRAAGTLVGTVAGVMLVVIADGQPVILVLGLALWIGLCTWSGNVLRGFVAYGTILAGYTAAMVALLDTAHPDHVLALGADRLLTVMTGVAEAIITQTLLSVACNAVHSVEARCCRWILSSRDRVGKDTIALTHEFLAEMLGVQRSTLSAVLRPLQTAGLIEQKRGAIAVRDRAGLERSACSCYHKIRDRVSRLQPPPLGHASN